MEYSNKNLPGVKKRGSAMLFLNCLDVNGRALMAVESGSQTEFEVWRELSLLFMLQVFFFASPPQKQKPTKKTTTTKRYPSGVRL